MQAIVTRYLPPTNHRGSRVKAQCDAGSLVVSWDYALNPDDNHDAACAALVKRLGWDGRWVGGGLPQSNPAARCYVCVPRKAHKVCRGCGTTRTVEEIDDRICYGCGLVSPKV